MTRATPAQIIGVMIVVRRDRSDHEILAELAALPAMDDEGSPAWSDDAYWQRVAFPYLALASVSALRRLRPAIRLLLERACHGDPGEIMRGLRHDLEAIVNPEWDVLADICLELARSSRPGTKLWAIDQLAILDDARAKPIFEDALSNAPPLIRDCAEIGLARLEKIE